MILLVVNGLKRNKSEAIVVDRDENLNYCVFSIEDEMEGRRKFS